MSKPALRDYSLIKRVAVAIVFAPLIIWIFIARGIPLFVFSVIVTLVGQWELFGMFGHRISVLQRIIAYAAGFSILTGAFLGSTGWFFGLMVAVTAISFVIEILNGTTDRMTRVAFTLFSVVYPAAFMSFLPAIAAFDVPSFASSMRWMIVFMIAVVWVFDSASYFAGRAFGRHPFFPSVSPKKTIEGFAGGIAGAVVTGIAAGGIIDSGGIIHFVILSVIIAFAGQAGDLSESIIKREMGIKDSSSIIPGHGGILDRFDSLFFAAPAVYLYLKAAICLF